MANFVDDLKNALDSIVSGAGDVVTTTRDVVKDNLVNTLQAGGEVASIPFQKRIGDYYREMI